MKKYVIILGILFVPWALSAQFIEDALRYNGYNSMITQRTAGLNVSYHGISDDYGALYFNPAGMTLISKSELSLGFGFTHNKAEAMFQENINEFSANNEYISHFGIVTPISNMKENRAAVAIGYFRESSFDNNIDFGGFNSGQSYINSETQGGPMDFNDNWAYLLYLNNAITDDNDNLLDFTTPFDDSLHQQTFIRESGGLHNISGGVAFDLNENFAIGFSLTGKWGGYDYDKELVEYIDADNSPDYYADTQIEGRSFNRLNHESTIEQIVTGISGSIGIQGRLEEFLRFGATVKFPTWYQVEENFWLNNEATFYNADPVFYSYEGENDYNLTTPFVYSAGVSMHVLGLTFSTGVEYSDASQLEFSDAIGEVEALNNDILRQLVGVTTWGFGAEYKVPLMPLMARASFARSTSPYQNDIANASKTYVSLGGSLLIGKQVRIDGVFRWTDVSELRSNYRNAGYELTNSPVQIGFGIAYRY
jgi:hypothetical protein